MEKYKIWGVLWGPVGAALVLSLLFWYSKPNLRRIKVPHVPQVYRSIPMVKLKQPKYMPLTHATVKSCAFLPSVRPLTIPHLSSTNTYELRSILSIGRRKVCKINEMLLKEGQRIGPFKVIFIGENYVELYNSKKKIRLFIGERLSF